MHHLYYLQLTCYVGLTLGVLRLLSRLAIKLIAIFAKEAISARAFKVLKMDQRERRVEISRARLAAGPAQLAADVEEPVRPADVEQARHEQAEDTDR